MERKELLKQIIIFALLICFWSVNWPMMKIGLTVLEPWFYRTLIVFIGGIGCLFVALLSGRSLKIPKENIKPLLWLGFTQGFLWNALSGFGIPLIEAGRAAILAFTMPIWATILSIIFLKEVVTLRSVFGLTFGMFGLFLLIYPTLDTLGTSFLGASLMIGGAFTWGAATIVFKAANWRADLLALCGWQFIIGAIPLSIATLVLGDPTTIFYLDLKTGSAVAFSAIVPMVFCQAVWFSIVTRLPTLIASTTTLFVPPLGVIFSFLILHEPISLFDFFALIAVIAAMLLILPGFRRQANHHQQLK
mgnify:FL=1